MDNIKVGDRVKATNENGDTAEFNVVLVRSTSPGYESKSNAYRKTDGWTFEKITPPLPTEPGLYIGSDESSPDMFLAIFALEQDGTWTRRSAHVWTSPDDVEAHARKVHNNVGLSRLVREVKS